MEEYSDELVRSSYKIYVRKLRSIRPLPTCLYKFLVVFHLCYKIITLSWTQDDDVSWPSLDIDVDCPPVWTVVPMTIRDFVIIEDAHCMMQEAIREWQIPASELSRLISQALFEARQAVVSMPEDHGHLHMNVNFTMTHSYGAPHLMAPREAAGAEDFMAEYDPRMVPSDDSSIQALLEKQVVIMLTESETCSVCLEELLEGSLGVSMPCEHLFHQDCIVKWLRSSHYCPICRFKMPTPTS